MASSINASTTAGVVTTADTSAILQLQTAGTTAIAIDASQNATFTNGANLPNTFGFKNRIINGAMVIDQRNAGASVTGALAGSYILDRWKFWVNGGSGSGASYTVQQSSTTPDGFSTSVLITQTGTATPTGNQYNVFAQYIEGNNVADLNWGATAAAAGKVAKPITLSFWVRSSLTGTFGGALSNNAQDRSYPYTYTINAANTWEQKTITVAGDTSGTWLTTNGTGLQVYFDLGSGSTIKGTAGAWAGAAYLGATGAGNWVGTNGATLYITGVQLEKGATATSFDFRPYGTELALCQRYYQQIGKSNNVSYQPYGVGVCTSTTAATIIINLPVMMRGTPTFTFTGATNTFSGSVGTAVTSVISDVMSPTTIMYQAVVASGFTSGNGARHYQSATSASSLELSAEL